MTERRFFVYHGADGTVARLSNEEAARFFENRDPREWEFVRYEYETEGKIHYVNHQEGT